MTRHKKTRRTIYVSEPAFVLAVLLLLFSFLGLNTAYGGSNFLGNAMPIGIIYPTPVGILFPGFNIAAGVNAAALPNGKKGTAMEVAAAPALKSGDSNSGMASIATSSQNIGWSLGYTNTTTNGDMTHGLFSGVGFKLNNLQLGMALRGNINNGFNPNVDAGMILHVSQDWVVGAVAYNLNNTPQAALGVGIGHPRKDNVEINVLTPAYGSSAVPATYLATFSATVYTGAFGTLFRTTYDTTGHDFTATLGALVWLGQDVNAGIELTTPRTLTFGITYVF